MLCLTLAPVTGFWCAHLAFMKTFSRALRKKMSWQRQFVRHVHGKLAAAQFQDGPSPLRERGAAGDNPDGAVVVVERSA